jgi:hypothetical protein
MRVVRELRNEIVLGTSQRNWLLEQRSRKEQTSSGSPGRKSLLTLSCTDQILPQSQSATNDPEQTRIHFMPG